MSEIDLARVEYEALRATIRERGTARMLALLLGIVAWGALAATLSLAAVSGATMLVPLVVLAATFEINFFIHIGVERIGRFIQVFHEERAGAIGWETTAMNFGARFRASGLDPLFSPIFFAATMLNFFSSVNTESHRGWIALSLAAHLAFNYRIVRARRISATQRSTELEHFRSLANER